MTTAIPPPPPPPQQVQVCLAPSPQLQIEVASAVRTQDPGLDLDLDLDLYNTHDPFDFFNDSGALSLSAEEIEHMSEMLLQQQCLQDVAPAPLADFVPFVDPLPPPPPPPTPPADEVEEVVEASGTVRAAAATNVIQQAVAAWLLRTDGKEFAAPDDNEDLGAPSKELIRACKAKISTASRTDQYYMQCVIAGTEPRKRPLTVVIQDPGVRKIGGARKSCAACIKGRRKCNKSDDGDGCERCRNKNIPCVEQARRRAVKRTVQPRSTVCTTCKHFGLARCKRAELGDVCRRCKRLGLPCE